MTATRTALDAATKDYALDYWRLQTARLLARYLLAISVERRLGDDFAHVIWGALHGGPSLSYSALDPALAPNERVLLDGLSDACGGWVAWRTSTRNPIAGGELAQAEWVSMADWLDEHGKRAA